MVRKAGWSGDILSLSTINMINEAESKLQAVYSSQWMLSIWFGPFYRFSAKMKKKQRSDDHYADLDLFIVSLSPRLLLLLPSLICDFIPAVNQFPLTPSFPPSIFSNISFSYLLNFLLAFTLLLVLSLTCILKAAI